MSKCIRGGEVMYVLLIERERKVLCDLVVFIIADGREVVLGLIVDGRVDILGLVVR